MNIVDVLDEHLINLNLKSQTKKEAIDELLAMLVKQNKITDHIDEIREEIYAREKDISTGIGKAIGLPHCKTSYTDSILLAIGRHKTGIKDYGALDDEPVRLIILIISPKDKPQEHTNMLSRISRLLKLDYIRNSLMSATSQKKFFDIIKNEDKKFL